MSITSQREIRALHVDDEPSLTDLTATFLEREDDRFTVETATSADEGVEMIDDSPPDCVVSDYNMPEMDGLEFLQAVREEYPYLPFLLYTDKGSECTSASRCGVIVPASSTASSQCGPPVTGTRTELLWLPNRHHGYW